MQALTAFWQKYRRALLCAALAAALIVTFFAVWWVKVLPAQTKSISQKYSDDYTASTPAVETELHQIFTTDQPLYGLALVFQCPNGQPQGDLLLRLLNAETGEELARSIGQMGNILPGQYIGLGLDRPVPAGTAARYELILEPSYQTDARLALGCSQKAVLPGQLSADGTELSGTLAMILSVGQIGSFLSRFYWTAAVLLIAVVCLVFWLATGRWKGTAHLHKLYALTAAALGLAFCLVLPPYSAPDEQFHINQAFSNATRLSTYLDFDGWHLSDVPLQTTFRRPGDVSPDLQDQNTTVFTWQAWSEQLGHSSPDRFGAYQEYANELQADNSSMLYAFSTLGVFLGFCLKQGFAVCLILGRLFNLAAFVALTAWAVKKAPFAKTLLMGAALLPMTLHLAVSFSRDSLLLGIAFAYTALCLDAAFGPHERLSWRQLVPLCVLGLILAPAKAVYLPLTALCLLIPAARLGHKPRAKQAGFLALCCLAFFLSAARFQLANFLGQNQAVPAVQEASVSAQAETSDAPEAPVPDAQGGPVNPDSICFTPGYMLHNPGRTAQLVIRSVIDNADHYIKSLVGGNLSYYSLDLSWGWVLLCYALLALCTMSGTGEQLPGTGPRLWMGLVALACCGLAVLGCISWTPTYYETIYGLQGRYFLPALPALLLALRGTKPAQRQGEGSGLAAAFALVNAGILLNTMLAIIAR